MIKMTFIKSNKYDTAFVKENMMGPNALKIVEELELSQFRFRNTLYMLSEEGFNRSATLLHNGEYWQIYEGKDRVKAEHLNTVLFNMKKMIWINYI